MSETEKCVWCGETERGLQDVLYFTCGSPVWATNKSDRARQGWPCIRRQVEQLDAQLDGVQFERDVARSQRDRIQSRLQWCNVNGRQAWLLRGVGEHDLWPLLSGKLDEKEE